MAQLNNLLNNGKLKITGTLYTTSFRLDAYPVTLNTAAIANASGTATPGLGLCTADQVKTYITTLKG